MLIGPISQLQLKIYLLVTHVFMSVSLLLYGSPLERFSMIQLYSGDTCLWQTTDKLIIRTETTLEDAKLHNVA